MTEQEMFNKVWHHFVTEENNLSISRLDGGSCAYHSESGAKCAAGLFISDEEYSSKLEGHNLHTLRGAGLLPEDHVLFVNFKLAKAMQVAHDSCVGKAYSNIEEQLRNVAIDFNLQIPQIKHE